ncbi:ANTAR domain-containing protein [Promicromonospora sp. NPDC057138]|uniref:ANTAR domain-containing protein n=1 Tax=Promicromonospora sp. NPDC057138 TaxID=3346031 RepID=UPI00362DC156
MHISAFPHELAHRAATVLGSRLEASIILGERGFAVRAGSSTSAAGRCDRAESLADDGPCVEAIESRTLQVVPVIADSERWEAWRDQSLREGFVSALAVPASVNASIAVALNLYSRSPDPWTRELVTAAASYVQIAASMVQLQLKLAEFEDATVGLYHQMSDLSTTERAVGAIMYANDCSDLEARRILESASRNRNVSQREVAETILRALVTGDMPRPGEDPGT